MLLIGSRKTWVDMPGTGAKFQLSPLSAEDRDACLAESADAGPAPLPEGASDAAKAAHAVQVTQARNRAWTRALLRRTVHGWSGLMHVNSVGDLEPLAFSPEATERLADEPEVVSFVENKALGLGLKVFDSLEEAGNVLRTGFGGSAVAARSA